MTDFGFQSLASVPGGLNYLGVWNANTNTPLITSGVGSPGDYYIVDVPGNTNIDGITDWAVGDWIIFSTTSVWQKIDNSDLEGYNLIQDEGMALPKRSIIDFVGGGVTASDDPLNLKTIVTINAASGKFGIADTNGVYTYYSTLQSAITAATAGQTVEFFTDYTETGAVTVTLKNGVNINGNGHTYTLSHSAAAVNAFTGSNVQMSFLNGNIVIDTATFSSIGLFVSGSNTDIDCTGLYIKVVSSGGTGRPLAASGGVVRNLRALSIDDLCASASRTTLFNCNLRATGTGNGLSLGLSTLGNVGNAYDCYIQSNSGAGAVVNVNSLCVNCNIVSTSGIGLSLLGGTIRGGSILTGANYAVSSNTEYSSGLHTGTAISNATIISTSTSVLMTAISTANNILRNCVISGGTNAVEISGTSLASNNYILSCTLSGAAGSNCIYSATLNTPCAYANNVYQTTTTPVSANITADIVNTQDNQGNILV